MTTKAKLLSLCRLLMLLAAVLFTTLTVLPTNLIANVESVAGGCGEGGCGCNGGTIPCCDLPGGITCWLERVKTD